MITRIIYLLSVLCLTTGCHSITQTKQTSLLKEKAEKAKLINAAEAVAKYRLANDPPNELFSIRIRPFDDSSLTDLSTNTSEKNVIASLGALTQYYVPYKDIRFPKPLERDPRDKSGHTFRSIEYIKTGQRVGIFEISKVQKISPTTIRVEYSYYKGPLNAHGQAYLVKNGLFGVKIIPLASRWLS